MATLVAMPVDRLGESIVIGVADAADGRLDAGLSQALGVFDRGVLTAPVAVVDEAGAMHRPPVIEGLLQGIQHETGMRGPLRPAIRRCADHRRR